MIGQTLAHYRITAALGAGGMGEVYRATDTTLGREVAIKVLPPEVAQDPERLARFKREAHFLAALNHPNIAAIHGLEEADGKPFLVLELVEGKNLREYLARGGIPVDETLEIATQVAKALEEAHSKGILHRDLKPDNVKLTADGSVKVLDFGIAKAWSSAGGPFATALPQSPTLVDTGTVVGTILGTPAYMSPEQALGKPVDQRADVWSFGVLLGEMLTGRSLFSGATAADTIEAVLTKEPNLEGLPATTPEGVRRLLGRCLRKDPRTRWPDIGAARLVLEDALAGTGTEAEAPAGRGAGGVEAPNPPPRRPWGWMAVSAALLVAVAVALVSRPSSVPDERVFSYSVPLPESGLVFAHAISPDGRHMAVFVGDAVRSAIYVSSLESWDLRLLTGTIGATSPFWSPDSRSIAFFADQRLKRVDVDGGPAEDLSDAPGLLGSVGTWGRGGAIIYSSPSRYAPGPLHRVPPGGGASQPLTTAAPGESHEFPTFLPDGEHFLYTRVGGSAPGIYLARLDAPNGRRLLADQSSAHFAPASPAGGEAQLLFTRDGNLMAHPFDSERLELTGQPFMLLERAPAISLSDGGILTYAGGTDRNLDSRFTWFDRSGELLSNLEQATGAPMPVALSPDESTIVLYRPPGLRNVDLYLLDLARAGSGTRFTDLGSVDISGNAVWAPNGEGIVFSARVADQIDLFWKPTRSSGDAQALLESPHPKYATDWSRDGRYILYTELSPRTQADVWYLPVEEDAVTAGIRAGDPIAFLESEYVESAAQLSPDGQWIAYTSDESGIAEIYVQPFPAGGMPYKVSEGAGAMPRWSADGSGLFFVTRSAGYMDFLSAAVRIRESSAPGGRSRFATDPAETLFSARMNVFNPATGTFFYAASRDGQRFLVNRMDGPEAPLLNIVVNWRRAFGITQGSR